MVKRSKISCVSVGLVRATIVTLICFLAYTLIATFCFGTIENMKVNSIFIMIFSCFSIFYGAVWAARTSGEKGWLMGLSVSILYIVIIYIISIAAGREAALVGRDFVRAIIAMVVGTLSGMIGINI